MLEMGNDAKKTRRQNAQAARSQSSNPLANTKWQVIIFLVYAMFLSHTWLQVCSDLLYV